ncbi:MAG: hypothetical protein K6E96_07185 [Bacteroidales bacterium]|nr:hypothetical protein [Bacteroidales bacterium]
MTIETMALQGRDRVHTGLAGIDIQRLKAMRDAGLRSCFNHLENTRYRIEFVARVRGREYINDAAARTINATWYTLETLQGGLIWIADANDQTADYSRLVPPALRKVRMLLVVGDAEDRMQHTFRGIIPTIVRCSNLGEALQHAYRYQTDDEVRVVYSPACYNGRSTNYQGEAFRHEVNEL